MDAIEIIRQLESRVAALENCSTTPVSIDEHAELERRVAALESKANGSDHTVSDSEAI